MLYALVTFLVGAAVASPALNYGWNWFPSGADARGHMTKVWMLERFWSMGDFPYPKWSEYWYCGYPFLWFYPPLSYFVPALIGYLTKVSVLTVWKLWIWLSYALACPSVYASARLMGASPIGSLIAAIAYGTSYNHIEITFTEGRIPTVFAIVFYALIPGLLVAVYRRTWQRGRWAGFMAVTLALTVLSHHSSGLIAVVLCLWYVVFRALRSGAMLIAGREHPPVVIAELPGHAWTLLAVFLALMSVSWWLGPAWEYSTYTYTTKPKWWISMSSVHYPFEFFIPYYWTTRYAKYVGAIQFFLGWAGLLLATRRRPRTFLPFTVAITLALFLSFGLVQRPMERVGFEPKWFVMFSSVILCTFVAFAVDRLRSLRRRVVLTALCAVMLIDAIFGLKFAYRPVHYTVSEISALRWVAKHAGPWDRTAEVGYRALWGMAPYVTGVPSVFGWYREGTTIRDVITQYERSFKRVEPKRALKIGDILGVKFLIVSARKPYARQIMDELGRMGVKPVLDLKWVKVYEFDPALGYRMDGVKSVFLGNKYRYMKFCRLLRFDPQRVPAYAFTRSPDCELIRRAHPEVVVMDHFPSFRVLETLRKFGVRKVLVLSYTRKFRARGFGITVIGDRPVRIAEALPKRTLKPVSVSVGHARFEVRGRGWVWVKVPYFPAWVPERGYRLGGVDNMVLLHVPGPTVVRFVWSPKPLWYVTSILGLCASLYLIASRRWRA